MNMPSSIHYHPEVLDVLLSKNFVSYGGAFLFRRILFNFLHKGFIDLTPGFLNIVFLKTSGANAIRANFNTHLEEKKTARNPRVSRKFAKFTSSTIST